MGYTHKLDPGPMSPDFGGYFLPHTYPGKETHSWLLYKTYDHWSFNHWQTMKFDEGLLNGSEKCLDWHYKNLTGKDPDFHSEMLATFSTDLSTFGEFTPTTKLTWLSEWEHNPMASWYLDEACGMNWWLCPFWAELFPSKTAPKEGWLMLTPNA
jgi:hypothetical protein